MYVMALHKNYLYNKILFLKQDYQAQLDLNSLLMPKCPYLTLCMLYPSLILA